VKGHHAPHWRHSRDDHFEIIRPERGEGICIGVSVRCIPAILEPDEFTAKTGRL